ncbi:uncharacterized protein BCR38DRAFT_99920 [Pseudomassariella vexata]|uniref:Secreted protein n=1 Tax=Pseudomassariella vexata TaxID=1141098 RepID=A0A1Y2EEW7_9PEZI|nr:uncharacterized protein BCR38DRAFT_99920 [Pseudomassariella vexata]ORY70111.1 hypothetical protein BCR38DRAFT_99920 [Pseudomassariella vexata]
MHVWPMRMETFFPLLLSIWFLSLELFLRVPRYPGFNSDWERTLDLVHRYLNLQVESELSYQLPGCERESISYIATYRISRTHILHSTRDLGLLEIQTSSTARRLSFSV